MVMVMVSMLIIIIIIISLSVIRLVYREDDVIYKLIRNLSVFTCPALTIDIR